MAPRLTRRRPPGPRWLLQCLLPLPFLGLWPVASMEIYTPGSLEALNGTDVRLKCTFHSSSPVGQRLTVSWSFQSQTQSQREFVFYYHEEAYPPKKGHFVDRVTWDGNVFTNDASIMIWNVNPTDNGTFQCTVNNPPDVTSIAGEIQLRVVLTVNFSEIHILALSIGTACLLMIVIMAVVVVFRHRRRVERDKKVELEHHRPEKEKLQQDPEEREKAKEMLQLGEEA